MQTDYSNKLLKISKMRMGGGGKINPRLRRAVLFVLILLFIPILYGYRAGLREKGAWDHRSIWYDTRVFHNPDSLLYYAERAYMHDDDYGLYVTATAAYIRAYGTAMPDYCVTVSLDEADIMLMHAADLGNQEAIWLRNAILNAPEPIIFNPR